MLGILVIDAPAQLDLYRYDPAVVPLHDRSGLVVAVLRPQVKEASFSRLGVGQQ